MLSRYLSFFRECSGRSRSGSRQDFRNCRESKLLTSAATHLNAAPHWPGAKFQEVPSIRACRVVFVLLTVALTAGLAPGACDNLYAQRSIELTLLSDSQSSSLDHQQWMQAMSEVGADHVRIRTAVRPRPEVTEGESGGQVIVQVKAVIDRGRIKFPGKSFARSDASGVRDFLTRLRDDGMKTTLAKKKAFGLTSEQLVAVHRQLATAIDSQTQGANTSSLVAQLLDALPMSYEISKAAQTRLNGQDEVAVKLNGVSAGTALSILLRRHGLVFHPQPKRGGGVELRVVRKEDTKEFWPPGWPVEAAPVNAFPKLFRRIPLQVNKTPLAGVLTAIERRLELPFIVDPGATIDKDGNAVDLSETLVSYNKAKTSYALALSKLLLQAKPRLRHELRKDENEKLFLWITRQ